MDFHYQRYSLQSARAKDDIVYRYCKKYYELKLLTDGYQVVCDNPAFKEIYEYVSGLADKNIKKYIFLTINPQVDDLNLLKNLVDKFTSSALIKRALYCYEVRAEDSGIHCHMLLDYGNSSYKNAVTRLENLKNSYLKGLDISVNLDYKKSDINSVNYILGEKKDPEKTQKVNDVVCSFRVKNNLQQFYTYTSSSDLKTLIEETNLLDSSSDE